MSSRTDENRLDVLRRRAERAIDEGRARHLVEPLLEKILLLADDDERSRAFAHRHLAELKLETDPWGSALHLRQAISFEPHDDVLHSLMALAQALLGNHRMAVACYRRALAVAPRNPWYHHNLGHILDVALDQPERALPHLMLALRTAQPPEHEIVASAAHCLARLGRLKEAKRLAERAVRAAPSNTDHRTLLRWIRDGAPGVDAPARSVRAAVEVVEADVPALLERHMRAAGLSASQVERARALWADYQGERDSRGKKPEVCAAAVHYAIALVHGLDGETQASIARRYGVAPRSLSMRYGEMRDVLALRPGDPRYAG